MKIIRKASVLDVSLGIWHYHTIGGKTPQVGEEKKYWSLNSNAGQQEEASWKTTNSSTSPDSRCPGGWLWFAGPTISQTKWVLTAISWADGQTGRWVSERKLLGLYYILPLPGFTDGKWKRWSVCVLFTLINYREQSPSSCTYKASSQHLYISVLMYSLLTMRILFLFKKYFRS